MMVSQQHPLLRLCSPAMGLNLSLTPKYLCRLQVILLSHFYLNLREAANTETELSGTPEMLDSLQFGRVVGELGGSLSFVQSDNDQEEQEVEEQEEIEMGQRLRVSSGSV